MQYKTEPLETYNWGKEMRLKHLQDPAQAKAQGQFFALGNMNWPKELLAGIGDFVYLAGEPLAVAMTREGSGMLGQCVEEVERRGYMRDMCSYMRVYWGSMFLNRTPWGEFPRPDLITCQSDCDYRGKWYQVVEEYLGVPRYCTDGCVHSVTDGTLKGKENAIRFIMNQYEDFIQWLEKFTGRKYDDSKLIEACANAYKSRALWGEVIQLNGAIPAPLDYKLLLPFFMAIEWYPYEKECVDMMTSLRDEVRYRVKNQIAATANERCRVLHEGLAPWFALYLFTYFRQAGVAVVGGSHHYGFVPLVQKPRPDGLFYPEDPINWEGVPHTREEAIRFRAMHQFYGEKLRLDVQARIMLQLESVRAWKAQGVILMYDRGCGRVSLGMPEVKLALQRERVPTLSYETNRVDPGEWSWTQVQDSCDTFLENLGVAVA